MRVLRKVAVLVIATTLFLSAAAPVGAYELLGYAIKEGAAHNGKVCFGATMTGAQRSAILEGLRDYVQEMPVNINYMADKGDCTGLSLGTDAYVRIFWDTSDPTCGPAAWAQAHDIVNNRADYFVIGIVKDCWDIGGIDLTLPVDPNKMDMYTIAVHEYGHVLGLDHFGTGAMNAIIPVGERRDVGGEMEDGIRAVYGW